MKDIAVEKLSQNIKIDFLNKKTIIANNKRNGLNNLSKNSKDN